MASITASPSIRTRAAQPAATPSIPDDHQPKNDVPGPDEHTLARTTAAVVTSLILVSGILIGAAYGAGAIIDAVAEWVFTR